MNPRQKQRLSGIGILVVSTLGLLYFGLTAGSVLVLALLAALATVGGGLVADSPRLYQVGLVAAAVCSLALAARQYLTYGVTLLAAELTLLSVVGAVQTYRSYRATA